ncbi:type III toxin-antitoxin system ToxN/AbiQ family toxin [Vagococcus xieshaowenii]|nr:type III toxin-antitoxin system ToxN/AbiQ family toxin [Vagococcus xieshaowenii]
MLEWIKVDKNYLDFLRVKEPRIPNSEYYDARGRKLLKPFFSPLFEMNDLVYVTQVSHPQQRHLRLRNSADFIKVFKPNNEKTGGIGDLYAVVNLNYMFPVPKELIQKIDNSKMDTYRDFDSEIGKSKYIDLLNKQIEKIRELGIEEMAIKLYERKYQFPEDRVSTRCLDYKDLEMIAKDYLGNNSVEN